MFGQKIGAIRRGIQWRLNFLRELSPCVGITGALTLSFAQDWNKVAQRIHRGLSIRQVHVRPKGYGTSVAIRFGSSDFRLFEQIFLAEQYLPVTKIGEPRAILDCGANVGYSTLFFLKRFPFARVIAVEPDPSNANLCRHNVRRYKDRVVVLQKAVWARATRLAFVEETRKPGLEWGIQVRESVAEENADTVEAVDIPSLIAEAGVKQIDLLKIDIEGSEAIVFQPNSAAWLDRVRNIAIELHGVACTATFRSALSNYSYLESQHGEVTFCAGIQPKDNKPPSPEESSSLTGGRSA